MAPSFQVKQGGLLALACTFVQDDGTPVDITGATIACQVRDQSGNLIATPTLTVTNASAGQVSFSALTDTTWPVGTVLFDVALTMPNTAGPFFTETVSVAVTTAITQLGG